MSKYAKAFDFLLHHTDNRSAGTRHPRGWTFFGVTEELLIAADSLPLTLLNARIIVNRELWEKASLMDIRDQSTANAMLYYAATYGLFRTRQILIRAYDRVKTFKIALLPGANDWACFLNGVSDQHHMREKMCLETIHFLLGEAAVHGTEFLRRSIDGAIATILQ